VMPEVLDARDPGVLLESQEGVLVTPLLVRTGRTSSSPNRLASAACFVPVMFWSRKNGTLYSCSAWRISELVPPNQKALLPHGKCQVAVVIPLDIVSRVGLLRADGDHGVEQASSKDRSALAWAQVEEYFECQAVAGGRGE
jgi:hypothetical protein